MPSYFDAEAGAPLLAAVDDLVADWPSVTSTKLFGCPSYRGAGTLFAVLVTGGIALTRLDDDDRAGLEDAFDTGPFQAGDRTVTKWVQVAVDDPATVADLEPYIRASYDAAIADA